MAEEIVNLASFDFDTSRLQQSLDSLQNRMFELKKENENYANELKKVKTETTNLIKEQDELKKSGQDLGDKYKSNNDKLKALGDSERELYKAQQNTAISTSRVRQELTATTNQLKAYTDAEAKKIDLGVSANNLMSREIKSINDARASNTELLRVRNQLNPAIKEESKIIEQLNKKIDSNNAYIKENVSAYEKQKIGIGDYVGGIKQAISETGLFNGAFREFSSVLAPAKIGFQQVKTSVSEVKDEFKNFVQGQKDVKEAQIAYTTAQNISNEATERATVVGFQYAQGLATETELEIANTTATQAQTTATQAQATATTLATTATSGMSIALKVLKFALIATGIGAIVVVLGSLIAFLATTQAGIDKVTAVTRTLTAVFQSLLGVAQVLGEKLVNAFSNPKKLLSDLVDFVKSQVMNRFKALAIVLDGIVNLDFDKVKEGFIQGATGVENFTEKIKDSAKQTKKFFDDAIKKGQELDRLEKELTQTRLSNTLQIGELTQKLKDQNKIAEDTNKTFAQRETANKEYIKVSGQINALKQRELDLEIAILKNKNDRNDTSNEEKQQLAELIAKKNEANAQEAELITTQNNKLNTLRKEANTKAIADAKARTEANLKAMQTELAYYLESQGERKKSMSEQLEIDKEFMKRSLDISKAEFDAKKLTRKEYELAILEIQNDFAKKQADATVENAEFELEQFILNNQRKLDANQFFTDELLNQELERINLVAEEQAKAQTIALQNGIINAQEYGIAIAKIDAEQFEQNKAVQLERDEAKKQQSIADQAIQDELNAERFEYDLALQLERYDREYAERKALAEKNGADMIAFEELEARKKQEIERIVQDNKMQLASQTFGNLIALAGQESAVGKALAIAQTTIDTYQAATAAYKAMAGIPVVGPALGGIAAGVAVASGLANVKKITAVKSGAQKVPGYRLGGKITDGVPINSTSGDNALILAKFGETMLTESQARNVGYDTLSKAGVPGYGSSSTLVQNNLDQNANNAMMSQMIADAVMIGAERGTANGSERGLIGLSDNRKIMENAKF